MSVENLKEYVRRCATEPELREKARSLGTADLEQHRLYSGSLGLEWSADDMMAFRKEVIDAEGDLVDLTEEELEQVAGGIAASTVAGAVAVGAAVGVVVGGAGAAAATTAAGGTAAASGGGGW